MKNKKLGELQVFKVGRVVRNRTFICKGLTLTWFFSHPNLKACNSAFMSILFQRGFFLFCISWKLYFHFWSKVRQKATETEFAFFIPLEIPRDAHWIIMTYPLWLPLQTDTYTYDLVEIFLKLSMKAVQVHLIIWTTLDRSRRIDKTNCRWRCALPVRQIPNPGAAHPHPWWATPPFPVRHTPIPREAHPHSRWRCAFPVSHIAILCEDVCSVVLPAHRE